MLDPNKTFGEEYGERTRNDSDFSVEAFFKEKLQQVTRFEDIEIYNTALTDPSFSALIKHDTTLRIPTIVEQTDLQQCYTEWGGLTLVAVSVAPEDLLALKETFARLIAIQCTDNKNPEVYRQLQTLCGQDPKIACPLPIQPPSTHALQAHTKQVDKDKDKDKDKDGYSSRDQKK